MSSLQLKIPKKLSNTFLDDKFFFNSVGKLFISLTAASTRSL